MKFTYDPEADALYIYLTHNKVSETQNLSDDINVDIDENGQTIGIEVLRFIQNHKQEFFQAFKQIEHTVWKWEESPHEA